MCTFVSLVRPCLITSGVLFVTRTHDRRTLEWEVMCGLEEVIGYLLLSGQRL